MVLVELTSSHGEKTNPFSTYTWRLQDGTITLVQPREMYGMTTGKSKGETQNADCLGCSWDFMVIFMGLSWDFHGIFMGFSWDLMGFYGDLMETWLI